MSEENPLTVMIPPTALTVPEYRDWIFAVEDKLRGSETEMDHRDAATGFVLKHTFTPGLYVREFTMPAGTLVTSRIHMFEHPFIISKGRVSVFDGEQIVTYEAPYQGVTKPGTKRILYNHEETVWTTFHTIIETSVEKIEESGTIVCDTFEDFEKLVHKEISL